MRLRGPAGGRAAGAVHVLLLALAVGVALLAQSGCGGRPDTKVAIIGIDGMDWQLIDPMIEQGRMPNLAALIDRGVRADFHSLEPEQKSPTIWTTIATGKGPQKHGITDFLEDTDEQPLFNSLGWRARPVWDILGEKGYTVGVINWLVSWPALPVNGYFVSDRIAYTPEDGYEDAPETTYPEELLDELEPYRRSAVDTGDDEIAFLMNGDLWRSEHGIETPEWGGGETVRSLYAQDRTSLDVAQYLLSSREQPDFFAVYFLGVDRCCHRFWGQMRPWTVDLIMSDEFIETFENTIERYYEHMDAMLGQLLDSLDENSTVIVCSDHGFRGPLRTKEGIKLGIAMHRPTGVFVAAGPGIRSGAQVTDASVLDVAPTVLALFGEPVGRDMDGFVLTGVIDEERLSDEPVAYVETYEKENGRPAREEPVESPMDEEIKEELRSLGYIE